MQTMYDGVNGSPSNKLLNLINSSATSITLDSASNLPTAPNIATIGDSATAEVILYTGKSGSTLTGVTRGFGGTTAQSWAANTPVYRAFTKYDYDAIKLNINTIGDATSTNLLINGGFDVWQRGTSLAAAGYTADRWGLWFDGTGVTMALTRQAFAAGQTDVPSNPNYYMRYNQSVAGSGSTYNVIEQRIENVRIGAGKTVTLSFYAKTDSNRNITTILSQNFGGGGSSVVYTGGVTHALTTSWQKFTQIIYIPSILGKTIGGNNYVSLQFALPVNTTFTFDLANVQLNYGSAALPFVPLRYDDELRRCRRYYRRYSSEVAYGALAIGQAMTATSADIIFVFDEMRVSPTMVSSAASLLTLTYGNASLTLGSAIAQLVTCKISATVRVTNGFTVLAAGQATLLSIFTDTSAFVAFDAEL